MRPTDAVYTTYLACLPDADCCASSRQLACRYGPVNARVVPAWRQVRLLPRYQGCLTYLASPGQDFARGSIGIVATVTRGYERGKAVPKKRQQVRLVLIACLLALMGLGAIVAWFSFIHLTLRVATGPVGSEGQKFLAAFVRTVADAHPRVRFKVVPTADLEASAKALADGQVDLAVVRSDMLASAPGQTIVILRRDVVGLIVPPHSPIETVRHLAGKDVEWYRMVCSQHFPRGGRQ
jgi:hypothetical protein